MASALRIPGSQDKVAIGSGWEIEGVVNVRIVGIVYNQKPRLSYICEPHLDLLKSIEALAAKFSDIHESLLCCILSARVNPENTPEATLSKLLPRALIADALQTGPQVTYQCPLSSANFRQTSLFPIPPSPDITNRLCRTPNT